MNEKLLKQKAEEYLRNKYGIIDVDGHYDEVSITHRAEQIKQMLVDFTEQETKLLSEHIVELQADKGRLVDENRKAREIIKRLHDCLLQDDSDEETRYYIIKYMTEAEQFLKENEK